MKRINKVAILGAGTMGARIAAHFANAGVPSYLFDIVPPDADGPARNKIAAAGLEAARKSKPVHTGIIKSNKTRQGRSVLSISKASLPLAARSTR